MQRILAGIYLILSIGHLIYELVEKKLSKRSRSCLDDRLHRDWHLSGMDCSDEKFVPKL